MLSEISQRKINTVCYDCMWNLKIIKQRRNKKTEDSRYSKQLEGRKEGHDRGRGLRCTGINYYV